MYLMGYSLDNLSLMALTLSLGFVVDDAIVSLENIYRHYEMGKTAFQAALDGSKEIAFTIVSMTLSLVAVFIPVFFMGGIVGRLFREFAVTIGIAVLISGVVAITLIPMLASRFMRHQDAAGAEAKEEDGNSLWDRVARLYKRTLAWNVRHTWLMAVITVSTLVAMGLLYHFIPKGFVPSEDQNRILIRTEAEQGVGFGALKERQKELMGVIQREVPELECFMSRAGGTGSDMNMGIMFLRLKPKAERKRGVAQIIADLRGKLSHVPGMKVYIQIPESIRVGARGGKSLYQYTLVGADTAELYKFAIEAEREMSSIPELLDVSSDLQLATPQIDVSIKRDQASKLGVSTQRIETALYSSYGSRQISTIYAPDDQYYVLLETIPERRETPDTMSTLYVRSDKGQLVPLDSLVCRKWVAGPLSVNHTGQLPSVTISFNLKDGISLGQAVELIDKKLSAKFPAGVSASFQGTADAFKKSTKGMGWLLLLTVMIIYMVLGILYESFIHPVTILTALPFAGAGALLSLYLLGFDLSIYAFVGLIMLVGIVKKNGIMMVDFAIEARKLGLSPENAIVKAATLRFRPIMMTTLTALMSGIPLAVASGLGSEARQPLGVSVVGGIVFSQLLTLYATPVFYVWMEKLQTRLKGGRDAAASPKS
jgi:HAE1 family hydrophobic/amphiphilic exporter-1